MKYMCDFEGGFGAEVEAEDVGTAAINFCEDHVDYEDGDLPPSIVVEVTDEEGETTTVYIAVNVEVTFTANT